MNLDRPQIPNNRSHVALKSRSIGKAARNAYSLADDREPRTAFDAAERDPDVRCVVLTGSGKTFSAGGDVKAMLEKTGMFEGDPFDCAAAISTASTACPTHRALRKAARRRSQRRAIGAGLDLACMCDIRIASREAQFGSTFVNGIRAGRRRRLVLARVLGFPRALELMLTGRLIAAPKPSASASSHRVVPDAELLAAATEKARRSPNAPLAVRLTKVAGLPSSAHDPGSGAECGRHLSRHRAKHGRPPRGGPSAAGKAPRSFRRPLNLLQGLLVNIAGERSGHPRRARHAFKSSYVADQSAPRAAALRIRLYGRIATRQAACAADEPPLGHHPRHGRIEEVRGPGVVGAQPRLEPGQHFEYTSGCVSRRPTAPCTAATR